MGSTLLLPCQPGTREERGDTEQTHLDVLHVCHVLLVQVRLAALSCTLWQNMPETSPIVLAICALVQHVPRRADGGCTASTEGLNWSAGFQQHADLSVECSREWLSLETEV